MSARRLASLELRHRAHPPAETAEIARIRLKTLIYRLRIKGDDYNADIAELEVLPFVADLARRHAEGVES